MARRRLHLSARPDGAQLRRRFDEIRAELGVPQSFPADVLQAAQNAVGRRPDPDHDLREIPFVTVDPPRATDLDQALHIKRSGEGFAVDYAIADVPCFVDPHGSVARESLRRGQTLYAPDKRTPLHPPVLSEDAASLLAGRDRPAIVWRLRLDAGGAVEQVDVVRALVRSREQLDYEQVQERADAGPGEAGGLVDTQAALLREVGRRRQVLERDRGGASLPLPDQEIETTPHGYALRLRANLPSEDWNAQISLMTGMAAASLMLEGGIGILRTMPPAAPEAVSRLRRQAAALGVPWDGAQSYGAFLARLDVARPADLALLHEAASLFRGAGYTPFADARPALVLHAAVAAPYAHVTAPLRRLVDRFALTCCLAVTQGREVPGWVREGLAALPERMRVSDQLAGELERRCLDAVEAATLGGREGETFAAVVVDVSKDGGTSGGKVALDDPPVLAPCEGPVSLGAAIRVRLVSVDPAGGGTGGGVHFAPA